MFEFVNNPNFQLAFAIVILVLLIVAAKYAQGLNSEGYLSYSSGAGMRFRQTPTATNQMPYQTGYNDDILTTLPTPAPAPASTPAPAPAPEHFGGEFQDQESILARQLYEEGQEHMSPEEQVSNELAAARGFSA